VPRAGGVEFVPNPLAFYYILLCTREGLYFHQAVNVREERMI
jgi:hypothetical protein